MSISSPRRTVTVWFFLVTFTAITIHLVYGKSLFIKLPWLRTSITMSTFTCLWAYSSWFLRRNILGNRSVEDAENEGILAVLFAILIVPINVLLIYPSLKTLGLDSNWKGYHLLLFSLITIHGIGFWVIQWWVLKQWNKRKTRRRRGGGRRKMERRGGDLVIQADKKD